MKHIKIFEDYLNESKISYSAVVLDKASRKKLLELGTMPKGWEPVAHHMTINIGPLVDPSLKDRTIRLEVVEAAEDDFVVAKMKISFPDKSNTLPLYKEKI